MRNWLLRGAESGARNGPIELADANGNSERPDTMSDWSATYTNAGGSQSPVRRRDSFNGACLRAARVRGEVALMDDVSIAYLPRNVAPEVLSISVLPPGVRCCNSFKCRWIQTSIVGT